MHYAEWVQYLYQGDEQGRYRQDISRRLSHPRVYLYLARTTGQPTQAAPFDSRVLTFMVAS